MDRYIYCAAILLVSLFVSMVCFAGDSSNETYPATPEKVVEEFCRKDFEGTRLGWGHGGFEDYSKYVLWKDESGWNRSMIVSGYEVTGVSSSHTSARVEVTYFVVGEFTRAYRFQSVGPKETVEYSLKKDGDKWRIVEPLTSPHVSIDVIIQDIEKITKENPDKDALQMLKYLKRTKAVHPAISYHYGIVLYCYDYFLNRGIWVFLFVVVPCIALAIILGRLNRNRIVRRMGPDEKIELIIKRHWIRYILNVVYIPAIFLSLEAFLMALESMSAPATHNTSVDLFLILFTIGTAFFTVYFLHKCVAMFSGIMIITNRNVFYTQYVSFWKIKRFSVNEIVNYSLAKSSLLGLRLLMDVADSEGVYFPNIAYTREVRTKLPRLFVQYQENAGAVENGPAGTPQADKPEKATEQTIDDILEPEVPPENEKKTYW